jgi:GNAT superfamily N-acetyltransferase
MKIISYEKVYLSQKPALAEQIDCLSDEAWAEFLTHAGTRHWRSLFTTFADFQVLLCADDGEKVIAVGHTVPFVWNGKVEDLPLTMSEIFVRAVDAFEMKRKPNTLSAVAAIVAREFQGRGLSSEVLKAMQSSAVGHNLDNFIAPVRPTLKCLYPLTPFERYVEWKRDDGLPFDPWLRTHRKLGAVPLKIMPKSMTVKGTIAEWEEWTKMKFPETGEYIINGAMQPLFIDIEQNVGVCDDPNIWMQHNLHGNK